MEHIFGGAFLDGILDGSGCGSGIGFTVASAEDCCNYDRNSDGDEKDRAEEAAAPRKRAGFCSPSEAA